MVYVVTGRITTGKRTHEVRNLAVAARDEAEASEVALKKTITAFRERGGKWVSGPKVTPLY